MCGVVAATIGARSAVRRSSPTKVSKRRILRDVVDEKCGAGLLVTYDSPNCSSLPGLSDLCVLRKSVALPLIARRHTPPRISTSAPREAYRCAGCGNHLTAAIECDLKLLRRLAAEAPGRVDRTPSQGTIGPRRRGVQTKNPALEKHQGRGSRHNTRGIPRFASARAFSASARNADVGGIFRNDRAA